MTVQQIAKYQIIAKIGQGAMGEVFHAHDPVLNRDVAVKTISGDMGGDDTLRKRFQREAQSAARLSHPNIITVYEFGEYEGKLFMAMELLEGMDLKQAIAQHTLTLDKKLDVMEQISEGLAFAHANDIVHRDLKPANVHLLPDGNVKIVDFGLARFGGSDMTRTGLVMGTPHYMSPEQVKGAKADSRSDTFSLGCVFYELLTGHKPFEAESMHAVLYKVMQEEPRPALELAGSVPAVVLQILDRALQKDPAERFQNAGEVLQAVRRARAQVAAGRGAEPLPEVARPRPPAPAGVATGTPARGLPAHAASTPVPAARTRTVLPPAPSRSRWPAYVAGALALTVVLAASLYWAQGRRTSPASGQQPPAQVQNLARAVIETQVELASKRLDAGDYAGAAAQAERALKLDPDNADARRIREEARKVISGIETATATLTAAQRSSDTAKAGAALWSLMLLDPSSPAVAQAGPAMDAALKGHVDEARQAMTEARGAAEQAQATLMPAFSEGVSLAREGESDARAGRSTAACRSFLIARDRFARARRTAH